ncbi:MAG: response regulator transcription factor [Rhodoblastus sp.]|nr:response regulator transcription factor [Rhodoblastus sp.]MCC0001928.1 response regulator transcription factor [Methylobacteriaceae bacterium]
MPSSGVRIVIADDHPLVRGALAQAVSGAAPGAEILEAGDLEGVTRIFSAGEDVDLILLDLAMPGVRGFSGLMYLRAEHPEVPVVVVSGNEDRGVMRRCIDFGASGFVPKTTPMEGMREAVRKVLEGGIWTPPDVDLSAPADKETADLVRRMASLTPQQVRVLMMVSAGLLNKQIAYELKVSEATVKAHVSAILTKLGVESRTQAVITAAKVEGLAGPAATVRATD